MPRKSLTVTLRPVDVRKTGGSLDLAMAAAILVASGQADAAAIEGALLYGELGIDGGVVTPRGAEAAGQLAKKMGLGLMTGREGRELRGATLSLGALGELRAGGRLLAAPSVAREFAPVDAACDARAGRALAVAAVSGVEALLIGEGEGGEGCRPDRTPHHGHAGFAGRGGDSGHRLE